MPGRRPRPTHLKVVDGTARKDRTNKREPRPPKGIPRCPAHLKGRSRDAWKHVAPMLDKMGVLTVADGPALELLCDAYALYREAKAVVDDCGLSYATTNPAGDPMYRQRPEVATMNDAWKNVLRALTEFGLTPAARSRVKAPAKDESDPLKKYLGG
jgi:P27 family predicted phage terminase small subunit